MQTSVSLVCKTDQAPGGHTSGLMFRALATWIVPLSSKFFMVIRFTVEIFLLGDKDIG